MSVQGILYPTHSTPSCQLFQWPSCPTGILCSTTWTEHSSQKPSRSLAISTLSLEWHSFLTTVSSHSSRLTSQSGCQGSPVCTVFMPGFLWHPAAFCARTKAFPSSCPFCCAAPRSLSLLLILFLFLSPQTYSTSQEAGPEFLVYSCPVLGRVSTLMTSIILYCIDLMITYPGSLQVRLDPCASTHRCRDFSPLLNSILSFHQHIKDDKV